MNIKAFVFFLFIQLGVLITFSTSYSQEVGEVIEIPLYKEYYLNVEPNATLIYDQKSPIKIYKVDSSTYKISVNQSLAKTSLMVLGANGVKNYFIKGQNPDADLTKKNINEKRLVQGYFKYNNSLSKNINSGNKSQAAYASWYNNLWLSENYRFITNLSYRNNYVPYDEYILDDYSLKFSKENKTGNVFYLYYGSLTEPIDRPYGFLGNSYRGTIFSASNVLGINWLFWDGGIKERDLKISDKLPKSSGMNANLNFNNHKLGVGYASNENIKVFNANATINWSNYLTSSFSSSNDGKVSIYSTEHGLYIPKDYQYLGLQTVSYSLGYVPEYSFGLYQTIVGKREDHKISAQFANQDIPKDLEQNEIELIPGILSTMISYNYTKFDLYQRDFISFNTIYNTSYLFSGLGGSYEKSYLADQLTETFFVKPYIELFFSGKLGRGFSLRNSHNFNYKTTLTPFSQNYNQQSSSLGLYYTDVGYRYGAFVGTGQDNINSVLNEAGASTYVYGVDGFWKRGRVGYNLNYTHTGVKNQDIYSDAFKASGNFYNKSHQFSLNLLYKQNHSGLTTNEDIQGSIAYVFNYDYGDYTLVEKVSHLRTSINGKICKDANLNNKCDDSDPIIQNIEVSISKDPQSETVTINKDGTFSFSNLPPRSFFLTLGKLPENFQTFKPLNVDLSAGAGSYNIDIPLIETEVFKVRPILKGKYMPYIPLNLTCNGILFNKSEIMTDYLALTKPKGVNCEEDFDFSGLDENIYLVNSELSKDGIKIYNLESSFKQIKGIFRFGEKGSKTSFYMNNEKVESDEDGSFLVIVTDKNPRITFSKPGYECQTSPSYDIFYKDINKFISVTVRCNPK